MTSSKPYLLRALFDWILDNGTTPYLVADATDENAQIPREFAKDGQITLNVSPSAVKGLLLGNAAVEFGARFGGVPMQVYVPMGSVLAVYARENGQGMVFGREPGGDDPEPSGDAPASGAASPKSLASRPRLKVVK